MIMASTFADSAERRRAPRFPDFSTPSTTRNREFHTSSFPERLESGRPLIYLSKHRFDPTGGSGKNDVLGRAFQQTICSSMDYSK
jgi:hypothetical protein